MQRIRNEFSNDESSSEEEELNANQANLNNQVIRQ